MATNVGHLSPVVQVQYSHYRPSSGLDTICLHGEINSTKTQLIIFIWLLW